MYILCLLYLSISISLSRYIYYCPNVIKKKEEEKKTIIKKKKSAADDICDDFKMTLLHTYIGHDLISRTVSLHTYSSRSKIYCNVLIKLYHTTAHHKKENRKEKICHQKNQSIFFVCSRRLKTISRILILIPEKKSHFHTH